MNTDKNYMREKKVPALYSEPLPFSISATQIKTHNPNCKAHFLIPFSPCLSTMMSESTHSNPNSSKFPFTATQFQELEHQALIYKYMVSNIPVPSDLLFAVKRSCSLDPSRLFARQTPARIGWSCFQMGLGKKIDPEPGRCRRTDGKKWRCSKEAYPDSKYCERHMHRGKNRSRKPVENGSQTSNSTNPTAVSSITKNNDVVQSNFLMSNSSQSHQFQSQHHHQDSSFPLVLDSAGSFSLSNTNYRSSYGLKDEVVEISSGSMRSLSGSSMEDAWQFTPLTMNSSSSTSSNLRGISEYPYLQLRSFNDHDSYSYVNGNLHSEQREEHEKTVHRFFDDLPRKNRDSWLDLDDKSQNSSSVSTTRLSISIPSPSHEFPIFNSSTHNG